MQHLAGWLLRLPAPVLRQELAWLKVPAQSNAEIMTAVSAALGDAVFVLKRRQRGAPKPDVAGK